MDERIEVTKEEFKKFKEACRNAESPNDALKEALKEAAQNQKQFEIGEVVRGKFTKETYTVAANIPDANGRIVVLNYDKEYTLVLAANLLKIKKGNSMKKNSFEIGDKVVYIKDAHECEVMANLPDAEGNIVVLRKDGRYMTQPQNFFNQKQFEIGEVVCNSQGEKEVIISNVLDDGKTIVTKDGGNQYCFVNVHNLFKCEKKKPKKTYGLNDVIE